MKKLQDYTVNQLQLLDFTLWILLIFEFILTIYLYNTARQFIILPLIGMIFIAGAIRTTNKLGLKKEKQQKEKTT